VRAEDDWPAYDREDLAMRLRLSMISTDCSGKTDPAQFGHCVVVDE